VLSKNKSADCVDVGIGGEGEDQMLHPFTVSIFTDFIDQSNCQISGMEVVAGHSGCEGN